MHVDIHSQYLEFPSPPLITNPQSCAQLSLAALKRNLEAHAACNPSILATGTRPEMVQRLSEILKTRKLDLLVKDMLSGNESGLENLWLGLDLAWTAFLSTWTTCHLHLYSFVAFFFHSDHPAWSHVFALDSARVYDHCCYCQPARIYIVSPSAQVFLMQLFVSWSFGRRSHICSPSCGRLWASSLIHSQAVLSRRAPKVILNEDISNFTLILCFLGTVLPAPWLTIELMMKER